jgi:hypothetical protein
MMATLRRSLRITVLSILFLGALPPSATEIGKTAQYFILLYLLYHIKGYFEKMEKNDIQEMMGFIFVDVDRNRPQPFPPPAKSP